MSSSMRLPSDEIQRIGFNDSVKVRERTFHVQTEVLLTGSIVIRTTILEGGVVRHAENRRCSDDGTGVEAFRALVQQQHRHFVDQLSSMGAPWLTSI